MQYELYYSTNPAIGGHGGPYPTPFEAKMEALRILAGNVNEKWVDIKTQDFRNQVARITRDDYYMVADKLGQVKLRTPEKTNMAQFSVRTIVTLSDVGDVALENSEVLHPDVLEKLKYNFEAWDFEITLDEVYELNKIQD